MAEPSAALGVPLAAGVQLRRAADCTVVLAPDGVTALAFGDDDLATLTGPNGEQRQALIAELAEAGILAGSTPSTPARRVALTGSGLEFRGLDRVAAAVDRALAGVPGWSIAAVGVVLLLVLVGGVVDGIADTDPVAAGLSPQTAAGTLVVVGAVLGIVHELGHALVLVRAGGRIGSVGFGFHWGAPSFYVDSTSALFLPTRSRIVQAAAGVFAECAAAGLAVVVAMPTGSEPATFVAGAAVVYALSSAIVNGAPVLGLDGSLIISDVIDRPTLPWGSTGAGHTTSRVTTIARGVDIIAGLLAIVASTWLWATLWWDLVGPLWNDGWLGRAVIAGALCPTVAAALIGVTSIIAGSPRVGKTGRVRRRPSHQAQIRSSARRPSSPAIPRTAPSVPRNRDCCVE